MLKKVVLIISIILLGYLWSEFWTTYLDTHTYYDKLLGNSKNISIMISWLLFSLIPWLYALFAKKKSLKGILLSFFIGLWLFGIAFTTSKGWVWWSLKLLVNSSFLYGLGIFLFVGLTALWDSLKSTFLKLKTETIFDVLLSLWFWLSIFLLINYILISFHIFYPLVTRWIVLFILFVIYSAREHLNNIGSIITQTVSISSLTTTQKGIILSLFLFTCLYLYLWFYLSDIAYSTAWDANHAYMFYPKMRALNWWYYWNEIWMATGFQLRYAFIAFWFSLFAPFGWFFGISTDTIAISTNFWSGLFVLIFWLWIVSELIWLLSDEWTKSWNWFFSFSIGRLLILLWLTSGMWAFLVFVDNKTDLGVMALIMIAIYSWLVALRSIQKTKNLSKRQPTLQNKNKNIAEESMIWKRWLTRHQFLLLSLSWFFYAVAWMAKPTALFDVVNFALFSWWIRIGPLGAIWVLLLILWWLSLIKFRWIETYISPAIWKILAIVWWVWLVVDLWKTFLQNTKRYLRYLLIRWWTFLFVYLLFKTPFHLAREIKFEYNSTPSQLIEKILFSHHTWWLQASHTIPLYAQLWTTGWEVCTLQSQWLSDPTQLYDTLKEAPWNTYNEDVGRYVWFGRKWNSNDIKKGIQPFISPRRWSFFKDGCYSMSIFSRDSVAKKLCEQESSRRAFDVTTLLSLQGKMKIDDPLYSVFEELITAAWNNTDSSALTTKFRSSLNDIQAQMQWNSLKVATVEWEKYIYIPYRYLNIFNISFNWSLQNLSSYYTDIGMIWLLLIFFSFFWLFYWVIVRNKVLTAIEVVTIFGWLLRFYIWWGILWYAIGVIIWTIMSFVSFVYVLLDDSSKENIVLSHIFVFMFVCIWLLQLGLNFVRISSQWWSGPFMRYKSNMWIVNEYDNQLQQVQRPKRDFNSQDVFNLQFPHYNDFISKMNQSTPEQGALIAWTYARYFVEDQTNIKYDQFLTWMREMTSDGDVCNSYLRMKDQNKKYIVIDPNIGTVVQWAWNQSLFDRFFARVDGSSWEILEDWVMTMLARMVESWYLKYSSSNNIWSKYAYILPNSSFGNLWENDRIVQRSRLSIPRFWWDSVLSNILQIAEQRINDGSYIEDLADMTWKDIDVAKVRKIISVWELNPTEIAALTQDERYVLVNYLNLRRMKQSDPSGFTTSLTKMLSQNIKSWSQIIVLDVVD